MKIIKLEKEEYIWLKDSDFFQNIDQNDMENDIDIIYCSIFEHDHFLILDVINIWGVNYLPQEILSTIFYFPEKTELINKLKELYENTNSDLYEFFIDFLEDNIGNPLNESAEKGFLDILIYFSKNGFFWNKNTCICAAKGGHLKCLKYSHENGCPWDEYTCTTAALHGKIECLKYAHENGCPWGKTTSKFAAQNGQIECLKYAHENSCPWDENTTQVASLNGQIECLKYAHENGFPWDENTTQFASLKGNLECLKYSHEHGCPYEKRKLLQSDFHEIRNYVKNAML